MSTLPLAYFITFRTYGTWLHGDIRGSFQRRSGAPPSSLSSMPRLERAMEQRLTQTAVRLDAERRDLVSATIHEVCAHRGWRLHGLSVRWEHVHVLVTSVSPIPPEQMMVSLKAWTTRRLVEERLRPRGAKTWSQHGSTRYVWTQLEIERVCRYIESQ